jgi:hypothetical protein
MTGKRTYDMWATTELLNLVSWNVVISLKKYKTFVKAFLTKFMGMQNLLQLWFDGSN